MPFIEILIAAAPYIVSLVTLLGVILKLKHTEKIHKKEVARANEEAAKNAHRIVYDEEIAARAKFRNDLMERVDVLQKQLQECLSRCQNCESEHLETKLLLATTQSKIQIFEMEINNLKQNKQTDY